MICFKNQRNFLNQLKTQFFFVDIHGILILDLQALILLISSDIKVLDAAQMVMEIVVLAMVLDQQLLLLLHAVGLASCPSPLLLGI